MVSVLWRESSTGTSSKNNGDIEADPDTRNGGSILHSTTLAAGESVTFPFAICWHFPNSNQSQGVENACATSCDYSSEPAPLRRPFYAPQWNGAGAVALHVAKNYQVLREKTRHFAHALWK
ncbi:MAG TPA: GH116 family glycosyl-hydrolase [Abditibacteriaceae bacterium]